MRSSWTTLTLFFVALLLPGVTLADTIYFCKAYKGGTFWAKAPCSQQQAATENSYEVPGRLSFTQQVAHASNMRQAASRQATQSTGLAGIQSGPVPGSEKECETLKQSILDLERMRRQARPTMSLDAISNELSIRRDRVSQLRCR